MNTLRKKNKLLIVTLSALCAALTTNCMELAKPKTAKRTKIINGTLSMCNAEGTVIYCPQEFHEQFFTDSRLKSSNADPVISTWIIDQNQSPDLYLMPAKFLYNLNDGSPITFTQAPRTNEHDFDECQFNLVCVKNENIPGKNFMEQYSNDMNKFYAGPVTFPVESIEYIQKLTANDLIKDCITLPVLLSPTETILVAFADHGTKGCSSEQAFVKTMTKEKTKPHDDSMHKLVVSRMFATKNALPHPKSENRDKLFERYAQFEKENNERIIRKLAEKKTHPKMPTYTKTHTNIDPEPKNISMKDVEFGSQRQIAKMQRNRLHGTECNLF